MAVAAWLLSARIARGQAAVPGWPVCRDPLTAVLCVRVVRLASGPTS